VAPGIGDGFGSMVLTAPPMGTNCHPRPHRTAPDTIRAMRVVVVGAGVMGAWTALWLRRAGHVVTLVDRHGPGNRLGSSGDESRITRSSHGPDRFYPVWQRRALAQWRELERAENETLFVQAGVVWLVTPGESFEAESLVSLTALGIPVEQWSHDQFAARVPVMSADGVPWALFEPEAGALFARPAVCATIRQFEAAGGEVVVGRVAPPAAGGGGLDMLAEVRLDDDRRLFGDAFVFACGPWLPDLFPALLGDLIVPHRQDVMQFAVPLGDARYGSDSLPLWIDFGGSFYGFPSFDGVGLKACPDWLGPVERPDESSREVADSTIDAARAVLRKRFPALSAQPVVKTWTCFYEVTPDAHFVIDRHPEIGNAWIAGGGTGHAFKHGPVIGEYLAALVSGDAATAAELAPPDGRFALRARDPKPGFRTSGRNPLVDAPS
jgi:sarcosine oxidase